MFKCSLETVDIDHFIHRFNFTVFETRFIAVKLNTLLNIHSRRSTLDDILETRLPLLKTSISCRVFSLRCLSSVSLLSPVSYLTMTESNGRFESTYLCPTIKALFTIHESRCFQIDHARLPSCSS